MLKTQAATVLAMALSAGFVYGQTDPRTFFKDRIKLTDVEIQTMEKGQVVTKVLTSGDATYGILVFGGVYVNGSIAKFAEVCRNVSKLQGEKVYLAVQEFSRIGAPPKLSDFNRLELERKDIDQLEHCKAGDCDVQVMDIEDFKKKVDWKSKDKYALANQLVRQRLFDGMTRYLAGGLKSLGSYVDRSKPMNLYQATKDMVDKSFYLPPDRAADIYRHVLEYPQGKLAGAEDILLLGENRLRAGAHRASKPSDAVSQGRRPGQTCGRQQAGLFNPLHTRGFADVLLCSRHAEPEQTRLLSDWNERFQNA